MRPTRKFRDLPYSFSPAVTSTQWKLSEKVAARFVCGAESLAASAVRSSDRFMVSMGGATAVTTSYVGKIFTATYTSDDVNLLACWSRYFPESVLDGYYWSWILSLLFTLAVWQCVKLCRTLLLSRVVLVADSTVYYGTRSLLGKQLLK